MTYSICSQDNRPDPISIWKVLYLIYRHIDVSFIDTYDRTSYLCHSLYKHEEAKATWAFRRFPGLVYDCSDQQTLVLYDVVYIDRPLTSLSHLNEKLYWISPEDTQPELETYVSSGAYDSVMILWPQSNYKRGLQIPTGGWGLASGGYERTYGATYATLIPARDQAWEIPTIGEPWLHEWLHGVAAYYRTQGCALPTHDADGSHLYGYTRSETAGWLLYYRDLMTGQVVQGNQTLGIAAATWQQGGIRGHCLRAFVDYFNANSLKTYTCVGEVAWCSEQQTVQLGGRVSSDRLGLLKRSVKALNRNLAGSHGLYRSLKLQGEFTVSSRVLIPKGGIGSEDSVALVIGTPTYDYQATLAYGTDPFHRNHIYIASTSRAVSNSVDLGIRIPFIFQPGWMTLKLKGSASTGMLWMKVWPDGNNEPVWQLSRHRLLQGEIHRIGIAHWGQGIQVTELIAFEGDL